MSFAVVEQTIELRTIGVAIRFSKCGDKQTDEVRYYISSLPLNVKLFAKSVRGHWAIENSLGDGQDLPR